MKDEIKVCAFCLFITTGLSCKDQEMRSNGNQVTLSIEDGSSLNGRGFSVTNGASIRSVMDVFGKPYSIVDIGGGTNVMEFSTVGMSDAPKDLVGFTIFVVEQKVVRVEPMIGDIHGLNLKRADISGLRFADIKIDVRNQNGEVNVLELEPMGLLPLETKTNQQGDVVITRLHITLREEDSSAFHDLTAKFLDELATVYVAGEPVAELRIVSEIDNGRFEIRLRESGIREERIIVKE